MVIAGNPIAPGLLSIAFIANFIVFFLPLYYLWPYNLHLLAGAWSLIESVAGQLYPATILARLVTLELRADRR